jgi:hypothetical protein
MNPAAASPIAADSMLQSQVAPEVPHLQKPRQVQDSPAADNRAFPGASSAASNAAAEPPAAAGCSSAAQTTAGNSPSPKAAAKAALRVKRLSPAMEATLPVAARPSEPRTASAFKSHSQTVKKKAGT